VVVTRACYLTEQHGYLSLETDNIGVAGPAQLHELIGDGVFGGAYQRPDEDVVRVWQAGVEEVRELLERGWRR
jgi:creatinine amidohydrolase